MTSKLFNEGNVRNKSILILLVISIILQGCATMNTMSAKYTIELQKVEKPKEPKKQYNEKTIEVLEENKYIYEDDLIKITLFPSANDILFTIINKTDYSLKIIWDEASYIDPINLNHKIIHKGVKYINKNQSQPPSIISSKGNLMDRIISSDNVFFISGRYGGWRELPFLPINANYNDTPESFNKKVKLFEGRTIKLLLPIRIQDITTEYTFVFNIKSVEIGKSWQ